MHVVWKLPYMGDDILSNAVKFYTSIFSYEGKGGLLWTLKQKNWAEYLTVVDENYIQ